MTVVSTQGKSDMFLRHEHEIGTFAISDYWEITPGNESIDVYSFSVYKNVIKFTVTNSQLDIAEVELFYLVCSSSARSVKCYLAAIPVICTVMYCF
jgi:hypothetical protein